jgi:hypothetical protein
MTWQVIIVQRCLMRWIDCMRREKGSPIKNRKIRDFKAPGPDGLHVVFYKQFWNVCGEEITSEVYRH